MHKITQIMAYHAGYSIKEDAIDEHTLIKRLNFDDIDRQEILLNIEDDFEISITNEELVSATRIKDLIALIESKTQGELS